MNDAPKITLTMLKEKGACSSQVNLFEATFGEEVIVTVARAKKFADKFDWGWAAEEFLTATARAECDRVTAPAFAECERIRAPAWAEYSRITAAASAEYERIRAAAFAEYERIRGDELGQVRRAVDREWPGKCEDRPQGPQGKRRLDGIRRSGRNGFTAA